MSMTEARQEVEFHCRVGRQLSAGPDGTRLPIVRLTGDQMKCLLEYSASIPTGKIIGKRWRRRLNNTGTKWVIGGYEELSAEDKLRWPGEIAMLWLWPVVDDGQPGYWKGDE
jgi:hypothetical protein